MLEYKVKVLFMDKAVSAVYTFESLSDALDFQYRTKDMRKCKMKLYASREHEKI